MLSAVVFCFKIAESILTHCACDSILQSVVRCEWSEMSETTVCWTEDLCGGVNRIYNYTYAAQLDLCLRHHYNYHFHSGCQPGSLGICLNHMVNLVDDFLTKRR